MTHHLWVPRDCETPLQTVDRPHYQLRYAYTRSGDSQQAGEPGQDFLAVSHSDQRLCLVLCDGVSQSFFGDLAAEFLGRALLGWLEQALPGSMRPGALTEELTCRLTEWTAPATALVAAHPLPAGLPPLLETVLEQKRARGSETTFVAGRVDLPGAEWPRGRLVVAAMGDSRIRLWQASGGGEGRPEEVPVTDQPCSARDRWSSRTGCVGAGPHLYTAPLIDGPRQLVALMLYTDGFASLDREPSPLPTAALSSWGEPWALPPDDATWLEILLQPLSAVAASPIKPSRRRRRRRKAGRLRWLLGMLAIGMIALLLAAVTRR